MRYSIIAEDSKTIIMTRYITLDTFEVNKKFKYGEKGNYGAKESTQNILFLFIFNKLIFLSRFVHVLYKNGRQKSVFT